MNNPDQNFALALGDAAKQIRRMAFQFPDADGLTTFFSVNGKCYRLRLTEIELGELEDDGRVDPVAAAVQKGAEMDVMEDCTCHPRDSSQLCEKCLSEYEQPKLTEDERKFYSAAIQDICGGELKTAPFSDTKKATESFDSKNDVWSFGNIFYSEGVEEPTVRFVSFNSGLVRKPVDVYPMMPEVMQIGHKCGRLTP